MTAGNSTASIESHYGLFSDGEENKRLHLSFTFGPKQVRQITIYPIDSDHLSSIVVFARAQAGEKAARFFSMLNDVCHGGKQGSCLLCFRIVLRLFGSSPIVHDAIDHITSSV